MTRDHDAAMTLPEDEHKNQHGPGGGHLCARWTGGRPMKDTSDARMLALFGLSQAEAFPPYNLIPVIYPCLELSDDP